jgi:hypothetical protein
MFGALLVLEAAWELWPALHLLLYPVATKP